MMTTATLRTSSSSDLSELAALVLLLQLACVQHRYRNIAVIDIGKTNIKVVLVDLLAMREIAARRAANRVRMDGPYPHFDDRAIWDFIQQSLRELRGEGRIDAITVTAHGASGALLKGDGELALPILDYEFGGPDALAVEYDAIRPPFAETGSPRMPGGLNFGAQLFWQQTMFPREFADAASIVTLPQYWTQRLSGVVSCDLSSIGAHTDLWNPSDGAFSSLVDRLGWRRLIAPVHKASDTIGTLKQELAESLGLAPGTPVHCGIHDSNAALLPHLLARAAPFSVVSTGTWVICMAIGGAPVVLDPTRDTLLTVNALGAPVPTAHYMGGREYASLALEMSEDWTEADVASVVEVQRLLLPTLHPEAGPYIGRRAEWLRCEGLTPQQRCVVVSFYVALMTAVSLELIGASGDTIVEGPFAANILFLGMLAAATGRDVIANESSFGTSIGAALSVTMSAAVLPEGKRVAAERQEWVRYAKAWREAVRRRG